MSHSSNTNSQSQSLHISGAKAYSDAEVNVPTSKALHHLQQKLSDFQIDNEKLSDQLNCLVSLIKRSWSGDKHATIHLSNIVGMEPPKCLHSLTAQDGTEARPNSQIQQFEKTSIKTRCEKNWERLTLKLLEHDYQAVEEEIKEYQKRYIENRQAYMDAVLQDHKHSMSHISLHRKTDPVPLHQFDSRFIKHNQVLKRMGTNMKNGIRRVNSAGARRQMRFEDRVEGMDISMRDLVYETPSSSHFTDAQAPGESQSNVKPVSILKRPQSSYPSHGSQRPAKVDCYSNAQRYVQNNLFTVGESEGVRKNRPVSASSLREGDIVRSRPRSGSTQMTGGNDYKPRTAFITQRNERSLKNETTKPLVTKPKSSKQVRQNSSGDVNHRPLLQDSKRSNMRPQTDVICASVKKLEEANLQLKDNHSGTSDLNVTLDGPELFHKSQEAEDHDSERYTKDEVRPTVSVRIKSAFTRRPGFIDDFAKDEQAMRDMEADFKKNALSLQKKLGIGGNGFISY